jgi:DNA-binding response OmpR family regulator
VHARFDPARSASMSGTIRSELNRLDHTVARILIIDDDRTFVDLLRVHLSDAGYSVSIAGDAVAGLRAILADPPDLLLLDLNIPYLHGFEMLRALKNDALTRRMPVVIITGRDDEDAYVQALQIGIDGYLTKPVQREMLLSSVETALGPVRA